MMAATNDVVSARANTVRDPASWNMKAAATMTRPHTMMCGMMRTGRGDSGSRFSSTEPRSGRFLPRRNSTATMTMNGSTSRTPVRKKLGNQSFDDQYCRRPWTAPSRRPAMVATVIERNPPRRAAPRAPTTRALRPIGVSEPCNGPAMIAATTPMTAAMIQLMAARRWGLKPSSTAPFSLPAAARVASPKRLKRKRAASPSPMASEMPAAMSVFLGTAEPRPRKFWRGSSGMMLSGWRPVPPKFSWATPCR